ncbi:hypothetical protein PV721_40855 [Streptomyces sp. MB09-01]|uniref:hypothetical protein n=1 Tax=Streptomyces sp. MB09-01 TaxID=3028666 RepID=UPI0029B04D62|nr:hypothetical protein [Streptomyces sp. MB09-01]MDX3540540.1 hypothetical protein [Streptomyces sp. MB09-01]
MLTDVLTGWTAETSGGLTVLTAIAVWGWLRRRRPARPDSAAPAVSAGGRTVRTYTHLGARAADRQPVHLPTSQPAGTVVAWPTGARADAERFELTEALLPDGTYAAEWVGLHRRR